MWYSCRQLTVSLHLVHQVINLYRSGKKCSRGKSSHPIRGGTSQHEALLIVSFGRLNPTARLFQQRLLNSDNKKLTTLQKLDLENPIILCMSQVGMNRNFFMSGENTPVRE
jgi:hypothetical protein